MQEEINFVNSLFRDRAAMIEKQKIASEKNKDVPGVGNGKKF